MTKNKSASVEKILMDLGFKQPPELTPEQEEMFKRATDAEEQYLYDVERLLTRTDNNS